MEKDPAHLVRSLKLMNIHSPTRFAVFENCFKFLQKTQDDIKWLVFEIAIDVQLKNKKRWGMDSRTVWMVVETKEKQDELELKYPNSIILCDRSHIQDTDKEKALSQTTLLHEVCSVATAVPMAAPLREWPVKVSNLMCNCSHCVVNCINDTCIYSPWRKARMDSMIEKGAEEEGNKQTSS